MYILNGSKKEIVNADFVERFCCAEKDDAALIVASYGAQRPPVTLARYEDVREAKSALGDLFVALSGGQSCFDMPDSRLYHEEKEIHDSRERRKGGS